MTNALLAMINLILFVVSCKFERAGGIFIFAVLFVLTAGSALMLLMRKQHWSRRVGIAMNPNQTCTVVRVISPNQQSAGEVEMQSVPVGAAVTVDAAVTVGHRMPMQQDGTDHEKGEAPQGLAVAQAVPLGMLLDQPPASEAATPVAKASPAP